MREFKKRQWHLRALERIEIAEDYPNPPQLEDGKWYFSILDKNLKYGRWVEEKKKFVDVNGKYFNIYNSDILTGKIGYIGAQIYAKPDNII